MYKKIFLVILICITFLLGCWIIAHAIQIAGQDLSSTYLMFH